MKRPKERPTPTPMVLATASAKDENLPGINPCPNSRLIPSGIIRREQMTIVFFLLKEKKGRIESQI